ncbi:MAG: hypothetical protein H0W50_00630, partial [Parachlamydiaceae bacterium]|nr:hypothetical protein [Parachlamydiaceae bacterium]
DDFEILFEAVGLDKFRSLNLKHMALPEMVALGNTSINAYIVKTYLPGDTFETLFKEFGNLPLDPIDLKLKTQNLIDACHSAGKAVGELHAKTALHGETISANQVKNEIGNFYDNLNDLLENLPNELSKLIKVSHFRPFIERFKKNPGMAVIGFADISASQFTWAPNQPCQFGFFDLAMVVHTFDVTTKPLQSRALEYWDFFNMPARDGLPLGINLNELSLFQKAFKKGYLEEYNELKEMAADHFFDLAMAVNTLTLLVEDLGNAESIFIAEEIIQQKIEQLNRNLFIYSEEAEVLAKQTKSFEDIVIVQPKEPKLKVELKPQLDIKMKVDLIPELDKKSQNIGLSVEKSNYQAIQAEYEKLLSQLERPEWAGRREKDQLMLQALDKFLPPMKKPEGFPETIRQFRLRCQDQQDTAYFHTKSFDYLCFGKEKDSILIDIKLKEGNTIPRIKEALRFAVKNNSSQIFITWDIKYLNFDVVSYFKDLDLIVSVSSLKTQVNARTAKFPVIEIKRASS